MLLVCKVTLAWWTLFMKLSMIISTNCVVIGHLCTRCFAFNMYWWKNGIKRDQCNAEEISNEVKVRHQRNFGEISSPCFSSQTKRNSLSLYMALDVRTRPPTLYLILPCFPRASKLMMRAAIQPYLLDFFLRVSSFCFENRGWIPNDAWVVRSERGAF